MKVCKTKIELLKQKLASNPNDLKAKRDLSHLIITQKQQEINEQFPK